MATSRPAGIWTNSLVQTALCSPSRAASSEGPGLNSRCGSLIGGGTLSVEPTLVTRQIGASPLIACAAPAYLSRHGIPAEPRDLAAHSCLHFSELRWGRAWQFAREGDITSVAIQPRLECNDGPTLLAAALVGAGIALEPAFVVGPAIRRGALVPILAEWALPVIPLHAVYPANRNIARKVRSFVAMLAGAFTEHPDLGGAGR